MKKGRRWLSIIGFAGGFLLIGILIYIGLNKGNVIAERNYKMIFIPKIQDEKNDFWTSLIEGTQMAAEENHVDLRVIAAESEDDYKRQKELILEAIKEKPDVILLSPSRYSEVTETAKQIKAAGIKLVLIDSFLDEEIQDAAIATDNFQAGVKMGEFARKSLIKEDTVIGIVSHVQGTSTAIERSEGLAAGLEDDASRIVNTVFCNSEYDRAYQVTMTMLKEHPDITLIFGLNEYSAVGAARAIKDMGMTDKVRMVGFDSSTEEIRLIEEGVFSGIVIQKPFVMGYLGVETGISLMIGETFLEEVDSGSELITKENMYTEENQKLLFPFWDK